MPQTAPRYRRVLLKLSGEALMGAGSFGLDPSVLQYLAEQIGGLLNIGTEVGIVVGGGNIFRGAGLTSSGINRVQADQMGMLATVMNALAIQDILVRTGHDTRVMSALGIASLCEAYAQQEAVRHLRKGRVVIFAAGTGNPFFTTDSAAALRAVEINADLLVKATKVDGVYDADPVKDSSATRFAKLTYDEVLERRLGVMDLTAVVLCREHDMPLRVLNIGKAGALLSAVQGLDEGTLVTN